MDGSEENLTDPSGTRAAEGECGGGGHLMADHVHMLLSIPPSIGLWGSGFIKGKNAIAVARNHIDRAKNFVGQNFWERGYYVSTVGRDEAQIREYIRGAREGRAEAQSTEHVQVSKMPA
jgi:putative transposase